MPQDVSANMGGVQRLSETGISVLVVGAGIGGLWAALECWRKGQQVRIFERTAGPDTEGDFFSISPAACEAFKHWPRMKAEHEAAYRTPHIAFCSLTTGERIAEHQPMTFRTTDEHGKPIEADMKVYRHLRPRLHAILLKQLDAIGIQVEFGHRAVKYTETADKGAVEFENGVKLEADLVVAADGLGTKSYELVLGHPVRARSSGYAIYRVAFPVDNIEADPVLAAHYKLLDIRGSSPIELWFGLEGVQVFAQRTEDVFNWSIVHKDDGKSQESWESTSHNCTAADAVAHIERGTGLGPGSCPPILRRLVDATPPGPLLDWKIMWRDAQPRWASPRARVVQLGDAAHTFVPSSGNGANQAIEDAASLAECLRRAGRGGVPEGVRVHNLLRFERVSCSQIVGFQTQVNRDHVTPKLVKANPQGATGKWGRWVWAHDPEEYAREKYEEAREHLASGAPFKNTNVPPGYVYKPWNIDELLAIGARGDPIVLDGDWN